MPQIAFNGKNYDSIDDMPPAEREAYSHILSIFVDANHNGVPDIFEGDIRKNLMSLATSAVVVHGNQSYTLDNIPPEVRAKYEKAMAKLQQLGILNMPSGGPFGQMSNASQSSIAGMPAMPQSQPWASTPLVSSEPRQSPSVMEDVSGPKIIGIIAAVVIALLVCAAGAAIVFLYLNSR